MILIFIPILIGSILWALHFIFEFSIIIKYGLPFFFVVFHFFAVSIAAFFSIKVISKWRFFPSYFISISIIIFSCIGLIAVNQPWFVPFGLFGAGFGIGVYFGFSNALLHFTTEDPKFTGHFFALGQAILAIFIVIQTLIDLLANSWIYISYFLLIFLAVGILLMYCKADVKLPPQEPLSIRKYLSKKENLPELGLAFFSGFFFTNTYYSTIIILQPLGGLMELNIFVIVLFITFAIVALPCGILMDTFGRRITILLGLSIQALAFLLLSFSEITISLLIYIFPILLGIGLSFTIITSYVFFEELPPRKHLRDLGYIYMGVLGLGCVGGAVLGEVLRPLLALDPGNLTIILLFVFVIATFSISQLKETLPTKDELEWKGAIQYLYVLLRSGIPVHSQDLCEIQEGNYCMDEALLGGALIAISSILQEAAQNQNPLKVVKQENYSILIEESPKILVAVITLKELKIIRQKMQTFLEEFQEFFGEVIDSGLTDMRVYSPAKRLAEKFFS